MIGTGVPFALRKVITDHPIRIKASKKIAIDSFAFYLALAFREFLALRRVGNLAANVAVNVLVSRLAHKNLPVVLDSVITKFASDLWGRP